MNSPSCDDTRGAWRAEIGAMLSLAWPLVLSNLTMTLISATDVVLLGWLSAKDLAASALGLNLNIMFTLFALGIVYAASPLMAAEIGRRSNSVRDIGRTFHQSLWALATLIIPVWIILWHTEAVLLLLGQDPELAARAAHFIHGYQWSMLPFLLFQSLRGFTAALERPGWVLVVSICGIFINALLSWALIFGRLGLPALGLIGSGIATSIVWMLMALFLMLVIARDRQFRRYRLFGRLFQPDWERYRQIWRLGFPIACTLGFEAGAFCGAVWLMGLISADSVAAHTIAIQIASITFMVPMGLAQAASVRVGLAFGRGDPIGVGRAGWVSLTIAVGFMSLAALILLLFPGQLIGIFLDEESAANAPVIALAIPFVAIAAVFQIADGAQVVGAGMLRGVQDTRIPMLLAGFGYWGIGIGGGSLLAFGFSWNGIGIWTGLAAGLAFVAAALVMRWKRRDALGLLAPKPTPKQMA